MKYLKTQPGIFKIVESLLMIACFFCGVDYLAKGNNEAKFVAGNSLMIIFFVINVFFILLHCTFRWTCSCLLSVKNCIVRIIYDGVNKEFVHAIVASIVCATATILYLIVAVGCSNGDEDETGFSECWTYYLESVFAFCATLMFIIDASFLNAEREEKCGCC